MSNGFASAPWGPRKYNCSQLPCGVRYGNALVADAKRIQALEEMAADLLERSGTPGIVGRQQELGQTVVGAGAHVGPALAERILCALSQREYAICRGLPRGVPTLYITFGNDLHGLQNLAEVGAVGRDITRVAQCLEMECRIGKEASSWTDRLRGTCCG